MFFSWGGKNGDTQGGDSPERNDYRSTAASSSSAATARARSAVPPTSNSSSSASFNSPKKQLRSWSSSERPPLSPRSATKASMKRDERGRAPRPGLQGKVLGLPWNSLLQWDHVAAEVTHTRPRMPSLDLGSRLAEAEAKTPSIVLRKRTDDDGSKRRPRAGSWRVEHGAQRTNIVCALGPSSNTAEVLEEMIDGGMRVARINLSHGTFESHVAVIEALHEALRARGPRARVAVLLDTRGPELRTGRLDPDRCGRRKSALSATAGAGSGSGSGEEEEEEEGGKAAEEKRVELSLSDGDVVEILGVEDRAGGSAFLGGFYTDAELKGRKEGGQDEQDEKEEGRNKGPLGNYIARLSCNLGAAIATSTCPGSRVLIADGTVVLEVLSCHVGTRVEGEVGAGGHDRLPGTLPYIRCSALIIFNYIERAVRPSDAFPHPTYTFAAHLPTRARARTFKPTPTPSPTFLQGVLATPPLRSGRTSTFPEPTSTARPCRH